MRGTLRETQILDEILQGNDRLAGQLKSLLSRLYHSRSWRLTRPLRLLNAKLHRSTLLDHEILVAIRGQSLAQMERSQIDFSLFENELVVITGVPFDDVGGGQRGAQLARVALMRGMRVIYIYVYPTFNFRLKRFTASNVDIPRLLHVHIDSITPNELLRRITMQATVLIELPHPKVLPFLQTCKRRGIRTIFELIDDWETNLGGDWFDPSVYEQFVHQADLVLGTAQVLVEALKRKGRADAFYLPNAANERLFDKYKIYERPPDLPTGKKIGLYFGSLYGEWFAWDYLFEAARRNPEIDFVLIGDMPAGKDKDMPPNVLPLGLKNIEQLPAYLAFADFALLPFKPGKISDAVSPIKVFEYLFMQKPVVASRLTEIIGYPGVMIAENAAQFAMLCRQAALGEEPQTSEELKDNILSPHDAFIASNSWSSRLDTILDLSIAHRWQNSVSAIILIHNNRPIIGRCLTTLLQHNASFLKEVIVVDNASEDGGAEFVAQHFPTVKLIRNPVNGCASGRNLGVSAASGKYLAFFDSDQWFTSASAFLEALTILDSNPNIGAISWSAGWFDEAGHIGPVVDYCVNRAMNEQAQRYGYRLDVGYLSTSGLFMPRAVFDATSGFDTNFDPTTFEDTDLSMQIKQLGFDLAYRDLCGLRHQPHQTTRADSRSEAYLSLFEKNRAYFYAKWKDHPEFFTRYAG
ncbi:MAG: glycosyltransferase [Anaerolineales bacterium]